MTNKIEEAEDEAETFEGCLDLAAEMMNLFIECDDQKTVFNALALCVSNMADMATCDRQDFLNLFVWAVEQHHQAMLRFKDAIINEGKEHMQ